MDRNLYREGTLSGPVQQKNRFCPRRDKQEVLF